MTAVVGILNKRGIAIAADSAVTMTRRRNEKIANSANKMLRLSSVNPISVMITGSAGFIATPWDIIVRRYRQKNCNKSFSTVEACIEDFFSYIPTEKMFLSDDLGKEYLKYKLKGFWGEVVATVPEQERKEDGTLTNGKKILRAFQDRISSGIKYFKQCDIRPMFKDYSFELFKMYLGDMVDDLFTQKTDADDLFSLDEGYYPKVILDQIKADFTEAFYYYITNSCYDDPTHLIFSGFGKDEEYPVLIRVMVDDGFDSRICYQINNKDIYKISESNPIAICPFAQDDIMQALLTGIDPIFYNRVCEETEQQFDDFLGQLSFSAGPDMEKSEELKKILETVKYKDLIKQFKSYGKKLQATERSQWLKALRNYDLQDMARLAENFIAMTSFERHMTFSQEGVGGPIDLAVITKNNGFTWLNRKSWYHHKDVGGRYGKFGV
jgi:hypothetical protein